jgi:hypothetical protein
LSYDLIEKTKAYKKGGGVDNQFYIGQSIILSTDDAYFKRMTKDIRGFVSPYYNIELVIEQIIKNKPYDTARAFIRATGKKVPFEIKLNPKYIRQYAKGGGINNYAKGGWVLYDEDTQKLIKKYKTEAEAKADLYEYYGNANIVKESVWNKTTEPKVDRFMFEEEMYEFKKGGKTPKDFENLIYGVKVIETIGNKTNEVIVAMFQEKFERDAFLLKREERKARRISASSKEIPNYDYQIIPINPY